MQSSHLVFACRTMAGMSCSPIATATLISKGLSMAWLASGFFSKRSNLKAELAAALDAIANRDKALESLLCQLSTERLQYESESQLLAKNLARFRAKVHAVNEVLEPYTPKTQTLKNNKALQTELKEAEELIRKAKEAVISG